MPGILDSARAAKTTALGSLQTAANLEQERENTNEQISEQRKQSMISNTVSGGIGAGAIGAMAGMSATGIGAMAAGGMAVGALLGSIF